MEKMIEGQADIQVLGIPITYEDVELRYLKLKQMFSNTIDISSDENIAILIAFKFDF
jgi:hypothetical protein